jgi:hypothetical protein
VTCHVVTPYRRVSQPGFREMSLGVPRDVARGSARDRDGGGGINIVFWNLLAKINRSTEKYNSLLKRALTIIIGLFYLQLSLLITLTYREL